jgi:hypothetical protein
LQTRRSKGKKLVENFWTDRERFAAIGGDPVATRSKKRMPPRKALSEILAKSAG